jgi:hypothetical protein
MSPDDRLPDPGDVELVYRQREPGAAVYRCRDGSVLVAHPTAIARYCRRRLDREA